MKKAFLVILFVSAVCGLARCNSVPQFQLLAKTNVVVRIDGKETTKRDIERDAKIFMTLGMNKARRTKVKTGDLNVFRSYCRGAVQLTVNEACCARYAKEHGLTNSCASVERVTRIFEKRYGVYSKKLKRRHKIEDLKCMLGVNADRLDAFIRAGATYQTVTNHILSVRPVEVTDEMVCDRISEIARENASRAATNAWVYARATNVWRRVVAKELTFEEAATNYSEDVYLAMGCDWGTFSREALADDPAVIALLPSLKEGDVTPPVESDCGLAILRLDAIDQDGKYSFSRVFFRLPRFFNEESPEEALLVLRQTVERERIQEAINDVKSRLKIECPSGTDLFSDGASPLRVTGEDLAD